MVDDAILALEIGLCWGTLQQASLTQLIEAAGRHGFPTITVRPDVVSAEIENGLSVADLRRHLADAGVRVAVVDAISGADALAALKSVSGLSANEEQSYRIADTVGAPTLNLNFYQGGPASRDEVVETIGQVCRRAEARGLRIVLEFVPDTSLPDIGATFDVVRATGAANCAILLDPWHLARSGGTVEDVRRLPPGAIGALQLCDRNPPLPDATYVPMTGRDLPGEGQLPLHDLVRAALANRPGLSAEIEVFSAELRDLPVDAAAARTAAATAAWRAAR